MTSFKRFLTEGQLHIFDIDDTLFHTSAKIRVVKDGKVIRTLTNQEYNNYTLKDGEDFDYAEFRNATKFKDESKPMQSMIDNLNRIHNKIKLSLSPGSKIVAITARGNFDDEQKFFSKFKDHGIDIDDIPVRRAELVKGPALPAHKKLVYIREYLSKHPYNEVYMYDDSKTNLVAFLSLKREYPEKKFHAYLVTKDGKIQPFRG